MFVSWRRRLNPDAVYRLAMRQLRASPSVARALGAPLTASDTRAFVLSGGGVHLKNWRPVLRSRRCHLLFPLSGAAGRGIVSAEAKKTRGQYVFKLLAVDVPAARGGQSRIYLAGDDAAYEKGRILSELRDPLIATLVTEPLHEAEDETEEAQQLPIAPGVAAEAHVVTTVPSGEEAKAGEAQQAASGAAVAEAPAGEDAYAWDRFRAWMAAGKPAAPPAAR
jgi:hypothetical protein